MPYMPAPTPPKITSLSMMFTNGTIPPKGVKESCQPLIAPQLASVVTVANKAESAMPNRTSLPSMFPPDCRALTRWSVLARRGFPRASAQYATETPQRNKIAIADHTAQPCARDPVIIPSVYVRPDEMAKMANSSMKLDSGVGFSKG